jgi:hypothetical protein
MSAIITVCEKNGVSGVVSSLVNNNIRYCTSDAFNPGTQYTIPNPTSGIQRSYWKSICLAISGTYTQISNIRLYIMDLVWSNINIYIGSPTLTTAQYSIATGTPSVSGNAMVGSHPNITSRTSLFSYTSSNTFLVDSSTYTYSPSVIYTKHVVLQMEVLPGVSNGPIAAKNLTWIYDEV